MVPDEEDLGRIRRCLSDLGPWDDAVRLLALLDDQRIETTELRGAYASALRSGDEMRHQLESERAYSSRLYAIMTTYAASPEELARVLAQTFNDRAVNSLGRCSRCGYEGPGPAHDCAAAKVGQ